MFLYRIIRYLTLAAMAVTLFAFIYRPELADTLWPIFRWLIPAWIVLLFAVQIFATSDFEETPPLVALWNRLRGKSWRCPDCEKTYPIHVPLCMDCGQLRPLPAWVCPVCETRNAPRAPRCERCTLPRPAAR